MSDLKQTALHDLHVELGAKMVPFAGYSMPVHGLFDVGHMGQVVVRAKSGSYEDAALAMERLVPVDVLGLGEMRHLFVVVNAGCKDDDIALMREALSDSCEIEVLDDRALLALQGPQAEAALGLHRGGWLRDFRGEW